LVIARTFWALLAGFVAMALLIGGVTALLRRFTPGWIVETGKPTAGAVLVTLGASFLSATAGGYVTAVVAVGNALVQVLVLAIVVLALTAMSVLQQRGQQPIPFQLALVALTPMGVLAGGLLRMRVLGLL
jgi:hypothetical protein